MEPEGLYRTVIKVAIADALLLAGVYLVLVNRAWKIQCAMENGVNCEVARTSPHFSYSLFTISFSAISPSGMLLQSPPSLDWVQVLLAVFVVVNAWYAYSALRRRRALHVAGSETPQG